MNIDTSSLPSRPTSGAAQRASRPPSALTVPAQAMQTVTPRNVKEWTDYQASMLDSAQDTYGVTALEQTAHEHLVPAYTASQAPAGLGIGQAPLAYKVYDQAIAMNDVSKSDHIYSRPASSDAHPACSMFGFSPSTNNELGSPLTWSPDSGHTDTHPSTQQPSHAPSASEAFSWAHSVYQPMASQDVLVPKLEDNDATIKRHSFNPTMPKASCFSDELNIDPHSYSNSPAPSGVVGSLPMQWRRRPLPFLGSDTPTGEETDASERNMRGSLHSSSLPQSLQSTLPPRETAGTPQVTLSPAGFQQDNLPSSSSSRPWSPQDYLTYNVDASHRSVSPQNALLAPLPVYAGRFYTPGNTLFPDQQHQNAMSSAYRDRHYSNTSSESDPSLSAFRDTIRMPYRDSHSPMSSSVESYHSESTDDGEVGPHGGGASWSNGASRSSSSLSFNLESPYAPQSFFNGMQITSPEYAPDRSISAMSDSSITQPNLQLPLHTSMAQHFGYQRSSRPNVARRPIAMRHYSHHPYQVIHHQQYIPVPSMYRREQSYSPAMNDASRSAPDLSNPALFDTSLYLRTPSPLEQTENWVIPTEEEVRLAALHYREEKRNQDTNSESQDGRLSYSDAEVDIRMEMQNSEANQKTLSAKRKTRSASKSMPLSQLFDGDKIYVGPGHGEASTSSGHPHFVKIPSMPSSVPLPSLDASTNGQHLPSRISGSSIQLSQHFLPLHMLPTKRSRGRRPVVSPALDIDPNLASTTASTLQQVSFTGLTKTGKPKKIFVCRVPGCENCFRRSEHLKRHIRSIHTHDKPYACSFPTCKKAFARNDNLKQHQKNIHIGWTGLASPTFDEDSTAEAASLTASTSSQPKEETTSSVPKHTVGENSIIPKTETF